MEEFHRIRRLPPYVFEQVNRAKAAARNPGADIIDLGMGNPDLPAPAHVIEKLKETIGKPRTDRYSASRGIPGLRRAQAAYYERRFGVKLNPETQIVATLGSKEGFANMAQAITAPGDLVLVPNPSYPIHAFGFLMAGGVIRSVPSGADAGLLRGARARGHPFDPEADRGRGLLSVEPDRLCGRARLLQGAGPVRAQARHLLVLSDLAYAEVYFDEQSAALGAAGSGRDGYRGRVHLDVEDLLDAGLAHRLCGRQRAAHRGAGAREILSRLRRLHPDPGGRHRGAERPRTTASTKCARPTSGGATCWSKASAAPAGRSRRRRPPCSPGRRCRSRFAAIGSVEFSTLLVEKAEVAVSPGIGFGEHGEGFVRIALVENEQRIRQAARNIRRFLETRAGKVAQRRPACQTRLNAEFLPDCPMAEPLRVGLAGLGTVGSAVAAMLARSRAALRGARRPSDRARGLCLQGPAQG